MSTNVAPRLSRRLKHPKVLTVVIVVGLLSIVEFGVQAGYISELFLKQPTVIFALLVESLGMGVVQTHLLTTAWRVFITFVLSFLFGGTLSLVLWRYETLRRAYIPLLGAIFGTPIVLLYIVFVVIFGRGTAAIVAISVPIGSIPIVITSTDALATVDETLIKVARSFNAEPRQTIAKVIIPAAAPDIFTGIRIGFSYIVIAVTAVEFLLVTGTGLGGMISNAYLRFKNTEMFVGISLVVLIVIVAIFSFRQVEKVVRR